MPGIRAASLAAAAACAMVAWPAAAQRTLTIGASSAPTGMDPHYHSSDMNNAQLRQVFDHLIDLDNSGRFVPRLAESWRTIDDRTWEFRQRYSNPATDEPVRQALTTMVRIRPARAAYRDWAEPVL